MFLEENRRNPYTHDRYNTMVTLKLELKTAEALAIAEFLKRTTFADYKVNAKSENDAYLMMYACDKIRIALNEQGIRPL
jgi:hypothetical protein